ncbi:MAG: epoxide hydrolase, partial [Burkholderiales bacterium]
MQAFTICVDDAVIERIRQRLLDARWAVAPADDAEWKYGTETDWLHGLVDYWTTLYDWRAAERELNRWPQFCATVEGIVIHFQHVRGSASRPRPLLLTHGWPGSVLEFQASIEQLAFPGRFGGDPEQGFDLVIPSLPGYG